MSANKEPDRHKPSHAVRVKKILSEQLKKLADRNATSVPDEVNRAVREMLEREGLWPAKGANGVSEEGQKNGKAEQGGAS